MFHTCTHGDFLGAILGTGIAREKLGDIILQVLVCPLFSRIKTVCSYSYCTFDASCVLLLLVSLYGFVFL